MINRRTIIINHIIFGVCFGLMFPLIGTIIELYSLGLNFTFSNVAHLHSTSSLLLIIDLAPIILGVSAYYIGKKRSELSILAKKLMISNDLKDEKLILLNDLLIEKNQDIQQMAYATAHDLKSTLRGISSLISFLNDEEDTSKKNEYSELLGKRVKRMDNLLQGMLKYLRQCQVENNYSSFDPEKIIRSIKNENEHFQLTILGNASTVFLDENKFTQIFDELIDNSVRFTTAKEVHVKITFDHQKTGLMIIYTDNGPGIDEQFKNKIFNLYSTEESRDDRESIGVGMAIVKRLVSDLHGEISLVDHQNMKFVIKFPLT